jgi:hypothetical protein
VDATQWSGLPNGTLVMVTFYANDTVGNQGSDSVSVYIDKLAPWITIIIPNNGSIFNSTAWDFNFTINNGPIDTMWYTIGANNTIHTFTQNDTIDQNGWHVLPEGLISITFYVNDTAENQNSTSINVIKSADLLGPIINFINPMSNSSYITNILNITVEIIDDNAPSSGNVTIAIYNGALALEFNETLSYTGTLNQWYYEWSNISVYGYGDYYIKIKATDNAYNQNSNVTEYWKIIFYNEITPPTMTLWPGINGTVITTTDPFEIIIVINETYSSPDNVYINITWNPTERYTMEDIGNGAWRFNWANISDYSDGVYTITIWGSDSSLNSNPFSITFTISLNLGGGAGPGGGGFDLLGFLINFITSPIGLMILGSIALVVILTVVMSKRRGSRESEKERISVLTGKNMCEICGNYNPDSKFCSKFLIIKTEGQYDYCKGFKELKKKKEEEIITKIEELSEEEKAALLEPLKDTLCITCQYVDIQTQFCNKFMSYAQVKKGIFCKGYRAIQEKDVIRKEKGVIKKEKVQKRKEEIPSIKLMGELMCTICLHYEEDSGYCNKFQTYKHLEPTEVCEEFKRDKQKAYKY